MSQPVILIVGGGLAGLTAALRCATFSKVHIYYKTRRFQSASAWAQGGIAAVQDKEDSLQFHIEDTINAGYGLCHEKIVKKCVELGPLYLDELRKWGVPFSPDLHREGGHHHHRVAHVGDRTGQSLIHTLLHHVEKHPNITVHEHHFVIDVILEDGRACGLHVLDRKRNVIEPVAASAIVLATGGAGRVYLYSSNPPEANGDGIAIALRAGCRVANMEFFQFHPTLLHHPQLNSFLITEALRGAGAQLLTLQNERFTDELLPRDQVARAIDAEMKHSGAKHVWLDCRRVPDIESRFQGVVETCRSVGIDPATQMIPVVPGAHYCCGGVVVDDVGRTSVPGLFTIGEISHTGLHGANRLASNSLLEALVFAFELSKHLQNSKLELPPVGHLPQWDFGTSQPLEEEILVSHYWDEIRRSMWNFVGIVRSDERLQRALNRLHVIEEEIQELYWSRRPSVSLLELRNLCLVALTIIESAFRRRESRGLHTLVDVPFSSPEFKGEFHCHLDAFGRRHWNWVDLP